VNALTTLSPVTIAVLVGFLVIFNLALIAFVIGAAVHTQKNPMRPAVNNNQKTNRTTTNKTATNKTATSRNDDYWSGPKLTEREPV
jgi:hypothetical protein